LRGKFIPTLLLLAFSAQAETANQILSSWLGSSIERISSSEIRYCPDSTCEIFRASSADPDGLELYALLYLLYVSDYYYLTDHHKPTALVENFGAEQLQKLGVNCPDAEAPQGCVLSGLREQYGVSHFFGRYDEGAFVVVPSAP
jgi:hypothetical protein